VPRAAGLHEGIAVVGMGCRLPGGVETPEAFWEKLLAGFDGVRALPDQRLRDLPPSDRHSAPRGAFLERVDEFDPTFFGLSPREVVVMDPAHRLLLETAWHALEDAGIVPAALFNQEVGVFIGGGTSSYMKLVEASGLDRNLYMATGNVPSTAAGRISYLFGLTGPSVAVDTACSSSPDRHPPGLPEPAAAGVPCGACRRGEPDCGRRLYRDVCQQQHALRGRTLQDL
jgi:acyl transferase domain-containing protein